jgi:hypothetical protein
MARNKGIPTADEEALQQPTIDPIMLLTSMLSGGISGFQNASGEQKLLEAARAKLLQNPQDALPEFLKLLEKDVPIAKTTIMDALGGGANFGGAAAFNHQIMPNHPLLSNALAMPLIPTGAVAEDILSNKTENYLLRKHPILQDLWTRLKPTLSTPLLFRDSKNGR